MGKKLVIVESPAKSKTISKYLGKDYVIKASYGHVRDLPNRRLGVDLKENFEPSYTIMADKKKVVTELKKAAKTADTIYLATDPDREGEAIAWHVQHALDVKDDTKVKRIVFNEITKSAVQGAIENSREVDQMLVDAQQARRILDRLIGYKLSPILSKKIRKGLSAGRVQSVAVRLICEREKEILAFVPEEYWVIDGDFEIDKKDQLQARLHSINGDSKFKISNEEMANKVLSDLNGSDFKLSEIKTKRVKRHSQLPFITSTLQQEASRKLNWSAKRTMIVAQQLYEGLDIGGETTGLITYMRTDSTRIANEAIFSLRDYIEKEYGDKYLPEKPRFVKQKKGAQDAHEAIRPTSITRPPSKLKSMLSADQFKLYKLIWDRFVASQMMSAELESTQINVVSIGTKDDYLFRATGSVVVFDGFMKVYLEGKDHDDDDDKEQIFPKLTEGASAVAKSFDPQQKFTQPPYRYTEASLVKEMEEKGIGRPSTYAPTISTIIDRRYVEKDKKNLLPTELGMLVNDQLLKFFSDIIDVTFTAEMETKLDDISDAKYQWQDVVSSFYTPFESRLKNADEEMEKINTDRPSDEKCPTCGKDMVIKAGRFGDFLACTDFPNCKTTKSIVTELGVHCPECSSMLIEKRSKRGKVFFGCSGFPKCKYASWNKPVEGPCPSCKAPLLFEKNSRGGKKDIICDSCDYKKELS